MKLEQILQNNGITTDEISNTILNWEINNCTKAIPSPEWDNAIEIINDKDGETRYFVNPSSDEFAPLVEITYDNDGYVIDENGYDNEGNQIY